MILDIKTKYNFNQWVFPIMLKHEDKWIPCKSCNATGRITLADGEITYCPKCYGERGKKEYLPVKWMLGCEHHGQIKNIKVDLYSNKKYGESEYRYMLSSTGVGSGSLWYEEDLFLVEEEAQAECDRRNLEKK